MRPLARPFQVTLEIVSWGEGLAWLAKIVSPETAPGSIQVVDRDASEAVACAVMVIRAGRENRRATLAMLN